MSTNTQRINVERSIVINKDIETVFAYVANLRNDKNWRKEINDTTLSTPLPQLNSVARESSFLSKKVPARIATLQCTTFTPNESVAYTSLPTEDFYLANTRSVQAISPSTTRLTYSISFDIGIVKHGLGFSLPRFIIAWHTTKTMEKYLAALKAIFEK